ncbi:MAG TPA: hypothetical protein VGN52_07575 [Burkholderiales bacterium]|jgi:peptidoglycan/LPS O-acetylase OafA/YrhL
MARIKRTTALLAAFAFWSLLAGAVDAHFEVTRRGEPALWVFGSVLASIALIFAWYYADSTVRGYRKPRWLNVLMVCFAVIAVPLYLLKSRPRGARGRALLGCLGYALLVFAVSWIGDYAGHAMG